MNGWMLLLFLVAVLCLLGDERPPRRGLDFLDDSPALPVHELPVDEPFDQDHARTGLLDDYDD